MIKSIFFMVNPRFFFENVSGCSSQDLASRDVVSRAMTLEIREGRGVGPNKDGAGDVKIAAMGRPAMKKLGQMVGKSW